jgi:hypothetical protein
MLLIKGGGISTVFETKTGRPLRAPQRIENPSDYFASPVSGDGKIYVAAENGVVVVLKNSADYEVLAKNDVGDSIIATPAIADGSLIIRTRAKVLAVVAEERNASTQSAEPKPKRPQPPLNVSTASRAQ